MGMAEDAKELELILAATMRHVGAFSLVCASGVWAYFEIAPLVRHGGEAGWAANLSVVTLALASALAFVMGSRGAATFGVVCMVAAHLHLLLAHLLFVQLGTLLH